jgi:hypothetical protein
LFRDESAWPVRNLNRGGTGCGHLLYGLHRLVEDGLLTRLGRVRPPDDLDRIPLCTVVKKERLNDLRKGKVGLELNRRAHPRTQPVAGERPSEGHECGSERRRLLSQRLHLAPQSCRRLLADQEESGKLLIGVLRQMAFDVLHALPEEQASPSDELKLHFSKRVGGLLPALACRSLRKPAEFLQLLAGTEECQAEVIGSPLGRGRDHELPHKAGRRRSSQRNPPESGCRHVHDGTVRGAAKREQEPALE